MVDDIAGNTSLRTWRCDFAPFTMPWLGCESGEPPSLFSPFQGFIMISITGNTPGKKKPLFADWSIPFPPDLGDGGSVTLRDLLTRIVRAEVQAFRDRQRD